MSSSLSTGTDPAHAYIYNTELQTSDRDKRHLHLFNFSDIRIYVPISFGGFGEVRLKSALLSIGIQHKNVF